MLSNRVWARVVGVEHGVVVEHVRVDEDAGEIVVGCRLRMGAVRRCGRCQRWLRCHGHATTRGTQERSTIRSPGW